MVFTVFKVTSLGEEGEGESLSPALPSEVDAGARLGKSTEIVAMVRYQIGKRKTCWVTPARQPPREHISAAI